MTVLLWSVGATVVVSLISVIGVLTLALKDRLLKTVVFWLVGLSAGALMGGAFLHLLPEALEESGAEKIFFYLLMGFALFFLVEKLFHWRHCHEEICEVHSFAYMNLLGDGIHNFIDGLVIAASFAVDIKLGLATTVAVMIHEIPQEIGDFGVLIYGGFSKAKALLYNFLSAALAIVGAVAGVFLAASLNSFTAFLLPLTAGGFIYIASADLVPEMHKENDFKKSLLVFIWFLAGIIIMYALKAINL